mmetsp:Transcript_735/g.1633  ORF Transcript_735/g.1633 Transcript_735/m.1633 type:complete len:586 (-) Transcript_735:141-1898(-)
MNVTNNPIHNNERLMGLSSIVHQMRSKRAYNAWRQSFLKIYTSDLDPDGILNGQDNNARLLKQLETLSETILPVDNLVNSNGHVRNSMPNDRTTTISIRGRRMLTNLSEEVLKSEQILDEFMPKTSADVERFGYDKFELAAVLLQDGFVAYDLMRETRESLDRILKKLFAREEDEDIYSQEMSMEDHSMSSANAIGDDAYHKLLQHYSDTVESFVQVMEDLGFLTIMKQCVDVVYRGKESRKSRLSLKSTTGTSGNHTWSDSDNDDSNNIRDQNQYGMKGSVSHHRSCDGDSNPDEDGSGRDKEKKKKKLKLNRLSFGSSSSKKIKDKLKEGGTKITTKVKKRNRKSQNASSASSLPSSVSWRNRDSDDYESSTAPEEQRALDDEEESKEEDPPAEGEGGEEAEFLIYFDSKTNTIGRINRNKCGANSQLLIDTSKIGDDAYQNVIEDNEDKQQIILLLKKLEKKRLVEASWLDEIKKEKAAKKKGKGEDSKKKKKRSSKSTAGISKKGSKSAQKKKTKKPSNTSMSDTSSRSSGGFRNPLGEGPLSSSSTKKKKKKFTVEDYLGKYKKTAAKPDSAGWTKAHTQ